MRGWLYNLIMRWMDRHPRVARDPAVKADVLAAKAKYEQWAKDSPNQANSKVRK